MFIVLNQSTLSVNIYLIYFLTITWKDKGLVNLSFYPYCIANDGQIWNFGVNSINIFMHQRYVYSLLGKETEQYKL